MEHATAGQPGAKAKKGVGNQRGDTESNNRRARKGTKGGKPGDHTDWTTTINHRKVRMQRENRIRKRENENQEQREQETKKGKGSPRTEGREKIERGETKTANKK